MTAPVVLWSRGVALPDGAVVTLLHTHSRLYPQAIDVAERHARHNVAQVAGCELDDVAVVRLDADEYADAEDRYRREVDPGYPMQAPFLNGYGVVVGYLLPPPPPDDGIRVRCRDYEPHGRHPVQIVLPTSPGRLVTKTCEGVPA